MTSTTSPKDREDSSAESGSTSSTGTSTDALVLNSVSLKTKSVENVDLLVISEKQVEIRRGLTDLINLPTKTFPRRKVDTDLKR